MSVAEVKARATSGPAGIPGIKHVIAVASGKGGVGSPLYRAILPSVSRRSD